MEGGGGREGEVSGSGKEGGDVSENNSNVITISTPRG